LELSAASRAIRVVLIGYVHGGALRDLDPGHFS
jgi:hypothetical protein